MQNSITEIKIDKLMPHPLNANVMSEKVFKKLVRNIERTGRYEPIVVRRHPETKGSFEIINGHHRVKALTELGKNSADCVVWDLPDGEAAILLATLNRLSGSDVPAKKQELLSRLGKEFGYRELARLGPNTKKQIEQIINLKVPVRVSVPKVSINRPLVFFVSNEQLKIIEEALTIAEKKTGAETRAERKAKSLVLIAEEWTRNNLKESLNGCPQ